MISIIIPVYNTEKYLKRCIDSVLNQTYKDIEVLLINDGSTDNSGMICDEYAAKDNRVTVFHKPNQGVSAARNAGLDAANGDFIGFVDSDDYIEPEMYEKMIAAITIENAQICCCGYCEDYGLDKYIKSCRDVTVYSGVKDIFRAYFRQDYYTGFGNGNWNKLFSKAVIAGNRFEIYTNGEDIEFQCSIFKKSDSIVCIPDVLYHYMCADNADSATNKAFNSNYISILRIADNLLEFTEADYPDILCEAYAFHLTWYMVVIQKIYESEKSDIKKNNKYIECIRKTVLINKSNYVRNKYAKRLDKYYMYALLLHCMKWAIWFRSFVLIVRKSFKV